MAGRTYTTHCYCVHCEFWHRLTAVIGLTRCPDCGSRLRRKTHGPKNEELRQKNRENMHKISLGIPLY